MHTLTHNNVTETFKWVENVVLNKRWVTNKVHFTDIP